MKIIWIALVVWISWAVAFWYSSKMGFPSEGCYLWAIGSVGGFLAGFSWLE